MKNSWMFVITGMLLIVTTTGFGRMAYGVILPFMQEGMNFTTTQSGYLVRVNRTGVCCKFLVGCHHTIPCRCWECTCLYATTIDSH